MAKKTAPWQMNGGSVRRMPWHGEKRRTAAGERDLDRKALAREIAWCRVVADRKRARGKVEQADRTAAAEQEHRVNARNFGRPIPSEDEIATAADELRAEFARMAAERAEEEAA